jgi:hypothetical protein
MYEHVGMADNHHRRRSDKRQIAPYHKRTKNDEKSVIKRSQSMKEQRLMTILLRHTIVNNKEQRRPNHVEHHSNDHPLGGDC